MPKQWGQVAKAKVGERDPNILVLEEQTTVRPLDNIAAAWEQHSIEDPQDDSQVIFVTCPGRSCPLCRKPTSPEGDQYFPRSRRFAANVWSYKDGAVKVLIGGPMIFEQFDAAAEVGVDPQECDWVIHKEGSSRSTSYKLIRMDKTPFQHEVKPADLHDVTAFERTASPEQVFDALEKMGIDYDALPIPSFTLEEAMSFVLPFGKHKGLTLEQLLVTDDQYAEWLHGDMADRGRLGEAVFIALQTIFESKGKAEPIETVQEAAQAAPPPEDPAPSPSATGLVALVGPDGNTVEVPESAVEPMLKSGFGYPPEPEPEPEEPSQVTLVDPTGNEMQVPAEAAQALLDAGYKRKDEAPTPGTAREVPDDEVVQVKVADGPEVAMPFGGACQVMNAGAKVEFLDAEVDAAANRKLEFNQREGGPAQQSAVGRAMSAAEGDGEAAVEKLHQAAASEMSGGEPVEKTPPESDPDKPFTCGECQRGFKSKGALTQHANREHGGKGADAPEPAAESTNGGTEANSEVFDRVRALLASSPISKDYTKLLDLFAEVSGGKRNVTEFTEAELLKLEERLQA